MTSISNFYRSEISENIFSSDSVRAEFWKMVDANKTTISDNEKVHFVVLACMYDSLTNQILIVFDKKINKWIFQGGHIDKGETSRATLTREAKEELSLRINDSCVVEPFFITTTNTTYSSGSCQKHIDIYYLVSLDQSSIQKIKIFGEELSQIKWVSLDEAQEIVKKDSSSLGAVRKLKEILV